MLKPSRVMSVLLLLCAAAVWWALRTDTDAPAPPSAPATPPPQAQVRAEAHEENAEAPTETGEEGPLEAPVEDGPGPCIELRVNANGAPAAGAHVMTTLVSPDRRSFTDGDWRLGASGQARSWCSPGTFSVAVELPGFAPAIARVQLTQGGADVPLLIELQPGHTLRGHVLDEVTRQPLAGARLSAELDDFFGTMLRPTVATTDAQGAFQLSHLAAGTYTIEVEAADHIAESELSVKVPRDAPLRFALDALCRLEGQVVDDATGAPVAGAEVWVGEYEYLPEDTPPARTDAQGRFSLVVEEGDHHLAAKREELAGAYEGEVSVTQGGLVEGLVIRLRSTGLLSGTVFARSDRQPVKRADVTIQHAASGWSSSAETDDNGHFRSERVPTGKYVVTVKAHGFAEAEREGLQLEAGQELTLELALARESSLAGTMKDALGRPAHKVAVFAKTVDQASESGRRLYAVSNAKGEYAIRKLPPGHYQLEIVQLYGGTPLFQELTLGEGEAARVDFTLPDALGQVEGSVRRSSGGLPLYPVHVGVVPLSGTSPVWSSMKETGRFSLAVKPGTYAVLARYAGVDETESEKQRITVEAGKTVEVELTVADTVAETSGIVLNAWGDPTADVDVILSQGDLEAEGSSDARGHFTLKFPAKSEGALATLTAELGPEHATLRDVRVGSRDVVIRLLAPATLTGRVSARTGAPVKGFTLSVTRVRDDDLLIDPRAFSGDRFTVGGLPADDVELMVRTPDGRSGKAAMRLEPGAGKVELYVGELGRVVGRLVDASGAPYEGPVSVDSEKEEGRDVDADEHGRFEILALEPGPHLLEFTPPDSPESEEEEVRELPFTLRPGETLNLGDLGPKTGSVKQ